MTMLVLLERVFMKKGKKKKKKDVQYMVMSFNYVFIIRYAAHPMI